ncbi:aldehyde dehydrogenase family protein [Natribaculum luteum]|uniref:Aldehyde dehydrogenase family protein n=1 Tax=Natribaculum luteum TaxID=1586232 RepID=A0ABD5NVD3_9EURY|nr:aldehyde dehydrogenase family protein [Natribaculum luteum]
MDSLGQDNTVRNYVADDWVKPGSDEDVPTINPTTGAELATVPLSSQADVDEAGEAANDAFAERSSPAAEERILPLFELKIAP